MERDLGAIEKVQEFMLSAMQLGKQAVEHDVSGTSFEHTLEAGPQNRRAGRARRAAVALQVSIEPPDLLTYDVNGLASAWGHGHRFVDEPLGVKPEPDFPQH